jgi:serpin B
MNKNKIGENLIISPLSIFQALSLAANGARKDTLSEMLDVLQYENIDELNKINLEILSIVKNFSTIDIAFALMTTFNPLKEFKLIADKYSSPIEPLISVDQVNGWCNNKTHGKINKILDELSPNTLMILLNAVYFRGEWEYKFREFTRILPFYNFGNKVVNVETMTQIEYFNYYEDKKYQAIKLYFMKDYMSAIIILPSEGTDINKFINSLSISNEEYNKIIDRFNFVKVNLQLPKFELEFKDNLNEILKE